VLKLIALGIFVVGFQFAAPAQTVMQPKALNVVRSVVGDQNYDKLVLRLKSLNRDIESKGIHEFPGASGKMLTGYAYGEYYDWDLYFENIYLSSLLSGYFSDNCRNLLHARMMQPVRTGTI
jgi:hypothetical protein